MNVNLLIKTSARWVTDCPAGCSDTLGWNTDTLVSRNSDSSHKFPGGASLLHPNAAAALGTPGLAALLVAYILPVCALLAPCHPGAALRDLCHDPQGQDTGRG